MPLSKVLVIVLAVLVTRTSSESCSGDSDGPLCRRLLDLEKELRTVVSRLGELADVETEIKYLRAGERLRDEMIENLLKEVESLKVTRSGPFAEALVMQPDDDFQSDSEVKIPEMPSDVTSLFTKMEEVENKTLRVEQELDSERRVRRHLEEDLKETQSSIRILGDQLHNVTDPVTTRVAQVEEIVFSTLENMENSFLNDHLQKIYYKVDGVVYKNETRKLDERLEQVETGLKDVNTTTVYQILQELNGIERVIEHINSSVENNLSVRLNVLETNSVHKEQLKEVENKVSELSRQGDILGNHLAAVLSDVQDIQNSHQSLLNITEGLAATLGNFQVQLEALQNQSFSTADPVGEDLNVTKTEPEIEMINQTDETLNSSSEFTETTEVANATNETPWTWELETTTEVFVEELDSAESEKISSRLRMIGPIMENCEPPTLEDSHLLVDEEEDPVGRQILVFGCSPIGQYVLQRAPIPATCENGTWIGLFPTCIPLHSESEIEEISNQVKEENPCSARYGDLPDPINCTRFFKCWHGIATLMNCPQGLHFNPRTQQCDYPRAAKCAELENSATETLVDLIPPIRLEPDTLDKPYGLMGTGEAGQLIVHPRSSFTLRCLFPDSVWGSPFWNVQPFDLEAKITTTRTMKEKNAVRITVTSAKEENSGTYTCQTPFGMQHRLFVVIKAIRCPPITEDEENDDVFYRPTPEGEYRILGTTAEYQCEEGYSVTATCLANGKWSPSKPEECTLTRPKSSFPWRCPVIYTRHIPDLMLEIDEEQKVISFRCAGGLRLIGNSFTRCRDDGVWSHGSLPRCRP